MDSELLRLHIICTFYQPKETWKHRDLLASFVSYKVNLSDVNMRKGCLSTYIKSLSCLYCYLQKLLNIPQHIITNYKIKIKIQLFSNYIRGLFIKVRLGDPVDLCKKYLTWKI